MDRTDVELSESSAASANDTRAGSGEHLLSSNASTGTFMAWWYTSAGVR